jgi:hypothetical protein
MNELDGAQRLERRTRFHHHRIEAIEDALSSNQAVWTNRRVLIRRANCASGSSGFTPARPSRS